MTTTAETPNSLDGHHRLGALLLLSAPLAITFAALGVRHPVAGGVSAYVREGLGD